MPSMPRLRISSLGNAPSPIRLNVTGILFFLANSQSSLEALARMTPPPAYIIGLWELFISSAIHSRVERLKIFLLHLFILSLFIVSS